MGMSYPEEVDALLAPWLSSRTRDEITQVGIEFNFPIGPLATIDEVMASAQLAHRGYFREIPHETLGSVTVPGVPWKFEGRERRVSMPAPGLGQLAASRWTPRAASQGQSRTDAGDVAAPLAGVRVLDFGWIWSGPMVASILAEFGAEVIKVEHRGRLDNMRLRGHPNIDGWTPEGLAIEVNPYFNQINHDKGSVTVNLKDPRGQALLQRLVPQVDVVLENLTPGALAKSGFGYRTLREMNPSIVMLSMSSTGQYGPNNNYRAYGPIMSSQFGLERLVGYPGEAPVGMMNLGYGDPNSAAHALVPLLAALYERARTGQGCFIDMSQTESVVSVLTEAVLHWTMNRRLCEPTGNRHPAMAPHGVFPASEDDQWVSIAVADDAAWQRLVDVMGRPGWAREDRWATLAGRLAGQGELEDRLGRWSRGIGSRDRLVALLRAASIAASPVLSLTEQQRDPQFLSRSLRTPTEHPYLKVQQIYCTPWLMSRTPGRVRRASPLLGSDNGRVFGGLLGLDAAEIAALEAAGVIA